MSGASRPAQRRWRWAATAILALIVLVAVRSLLVQSFYVSSTSMQPLLQPGDRIVVVKPGAAAPLRGDVVVFDGTGSFEAAAATRGDGSAESGAAASAAHGIVGQVLSPIAEFFSVDAGETDYVKRVIGVAGDRVACCDTDRRLTVNGVAVREQYLYPGDAPSDQRFEVLVPPGRVWVMGDHRSQSADSRSQLGRPGGGMLRVERIVGRVAAVYWPPARIGTITRAGALDGIPQVAARVGGRLALGSWPAITPAAQR